MQREYLLWISWSSACHVDSCLPGIAWDSCLPGIAWLIFTSTLPAGVLLHVGLDQAWLLVHIGRRSALSLGVLMRLEYWKFRCQVLCDRFTRPL